MSFTEILQLATAVITSLGGGALIVLAFSSWLGKVWASRILQQERHQLELFRKEHEIRFSKLHLERAEAIKELALKLQELDDSLHQILKDFQPIEDSDLDTKIANFKRIHGEYITAHKKNRLYFSKETDQRMHRLALCARDAYIDITIHPLDVADTQYELLPDLLKERAEYWDDARKKFYNDIDQLKEKLEAEFREILGVDGSEKNNRDRS